MKTEKKSKGPANTLRKETQKQSKYIILLVQASTSADGEQCFFNKKTRCDIYLFNSPFSFLARCSYIVPKPKHYIKMAFFFHTTLDKSERSKAAKYVCFLTHVVKRIS